MGFFSDLIEAVTPWSEAQAEAPKEEETKVCECFYLLLWRRRGFDRYRDGFENLQIRRELIEDKMRRSEGLWCRGWSVGSGNFGSWME